MLRRNTCKHAAAELGAIDEPFRRLAHRFQAFEPKGQRRGHFLTRGAVILGLLRNEELGLEEGEPRGHDQIIGRQLDTHAPRAFHELQILLGKRQH